MIAADRILLEIRIGGDVVLGQVQAVVLVGLAGPQACALTSRWRTARVDASGRQCSNADDSQQLHAGMAKPSDERSRGEKPDRQCTPESANAMVAIGGDRIVQIRAIRSSQTTPMRPATSERRRSRPPARRKRHRRRPSCDQTAEKANFVRHEVRHTLPESADQHRPGPPRRPARSVL